MLSCLLKAGMLAGSIRALSISFSTFEYDGLAMFPGYCHKIICSVYPLKSLSKVRISLVFALTVLLIPYHLVSQVYINEIMASNATVHADPDYGNYCDWIELYNLSGQSIDLGGYFLSDDTTNLEMWTFPQGTVISAHGYLLIYADGTGNADGSGNGLHTPFRLAKAGEQVILSSAQSVIIDSITYPYQLNDISYGREADDIQALGYFESPTPGSANHIQSVVGISSVPIFSVAGGFHAGPQTIEISTTRPGIEIRYTTDGTEPWLGSEKYSSPFSIQQTTVLRVKTFEDGMLPGLTVTQSYFIDEPQNLPVVSLVTDPDHFFSDETGIYVIGTAGVPGYCTSVPHNVNQDWERPVNVELYELSGVVGLNQLAGAKIFGGCSRVRYPIKSLGFYARKEYETSSFRYRLFPDKPSDEYETFILRAAADDQPHTLFRDPLTQMLVKDVIDVDMQAYRPVVVYINGEYWGIHNLREKINEHYPEDNFGVNPDSVDMLKRNPENSWNVVHGSADHYNAMMDYIRQNDITQASHYNYIKTQMDVDEYINYQIVEIFFGGRDWPGNNIKFWRSREEPHNRWRWILYDLDHMFKEYFSDIMEEATEVDCGCSWPNPPWSTYLFRRLLENEEFKHEFIQRFSLYSNTVFARERIHQYINDMQVVYAPEIPRHIERWGGQKTDLPDNTWVSPIFNSVEEWESKVQELREFTDARHEMALKHVQDYFGITGLANLKASVEPDGAGDLMIADLIMQSPEFTGDFSMGETLSLEAYAEKGYLMSHWEVDHRNAADTSLIVKGDLWKYIESRDYPDPEWTSVDYDDAHWESGFAELGYGDGDEATVVGYGGDSQNKMPTTWFRKKFSIEDASRFERYILHLLVDDGARVFLNETEVIRFNLNRYWVGSSSLAETTIEGAAELYFHTYYMNPALFRNGENIIAVEIHQASATSSDISFDMDLIATELKDGTQQIIREHDLGLEMSGDKKATAVMIPDTNIVTNIFVNEIMARNDVAYPDEYGDYEDWIELYNAGQEPVDLAGLYLTDLITTTRPWVFPMDEPEITTILPDSFMVVFTDGDTEKGSLHTSFRLNSDGEEIALLQKVGDGFMIIDHVPFGTQYADVSYGRYPDGEQSFEFMPVYTPGTPNFFEIVDTSGTTDPTDTTDITEPVDTTDITDPVDTTDITDPVDTTSTFIPELADGVKIYPVPTGGPLYIQFNQALNRMNMPVEIRIYSTTGGMISATRHRSSERIRLSLEDQSPGLYLLHVRTANKVFVKRIVLY